MNFVAQLKERVVEAEADRDYYKGLVEAFFKGEVTGVGGLEEHVLAQWGRRRIEEMRKQAALLRSN